MKRNASEDLIPNRFIFWLTIAVIGYAIFSAVKDQSKSNDKEKNNATVERAAPASPTQPSQMVTNEQKTINVKSPNPPTSAPQQPAATSPIPLPPAESVPSSGENHGMVERMVSRYLAPTLQKSVETQIGARLDQLHRQKDSMAANPSSRRMELKIFDKVIGDGRTVTKGMKVTFDVTLWYFDGLEIYPKRTVTLTQGQEQTFAGIEQGLLGMKKDGNRTLIIPTHLLASKNANVLGVVNFYPESGLLAEVEVKDVK